MLPPSTLQMQATEADSCFKMTTCIFIRHGQSLSNQSRIFAGQMDFSLSPQGHKQAEAVATYLKTYHIDAIYTSDLARAKETALHIAAYHLAPVLEDIRLREIHAGIWQGETFETLEKNPLYKKWYVEDVDLKPDGGESARDVQTRIRAFLKEVVSRHNNEKICIVTHSRALRALDCDWHGIPLSHLSTLKGATNASVSIIEVQDDGRFEITLYQEDSFMDDTCRDVSNLE